MICNFKNLFVPLSVAPAPPIYAECSQTYVKLVQKNEQMVNSVLLICSLLMVLTPKYTDNLGL